MELDYLALFVAIAALASYVQAVTGFAFGLIMVSVTTIAGIAPVQFTAAFVSFSALAGALISIRGNVGEIRWDVARATLAGLLPATLAGFWLLSYLSSNHAAYLQLILGLTILAGGGLLMLNPALYPQDSRQYSFVLAGIAGGLMGGAFSVPGPPVVYHLYRQPVAIASIKVTLLIVLSAVYLLRIIMLGFDDSVGNEALMISLLVFPVVLGGTLLGRYYPPPISDQMLRRSAFVLLSVMGSAMIATA